MIFKTEKIEGIDIQILPRAGNISKQIQIEGIDIENLKSWLRFTKSKVCNLKLYIVPLWDFRVPLWDTFSSNWGVHRKFEIFTADFTNLLAMLHPALENRVASDNFQPYRQKV